MDAVDNLEEIIKKLRAISEQVMDELPKITSRITQMAMLIVHRMGEYEEKCRKIILEINNKSVDVKVSDVAQWKIPEVEINKNFAMESLFRVKELSEGFKAALERLSFCSVHVNGVMVKLRCEQDHCRECLREMIESGVEMCQCGWVLSLKDRSGIQKGGSKKFQKVIS